MRYADCQEQRMRGSFHFPIEFHHVDGSHPRIWIMNCSA